MTMMRVVGECFFWYRLTRVFPDKFHRAVKRLCVVCVCVLIQISCICIMHYTVYIHTWTFGTVLITLCCCIGLFYRSDFHWARDVPHSWTSCWGNLSVISVCSQVQCKFCCSGFVITFINVLLMYFNMFALTTTHRVIVIIILYYSTRDWPSYRNQIVYE